ncbi:hypothetical protein V8B97DRAFT_1877433, partial [Scleroderma yunnanense]
EFYAISYKYSEVMQERKLYICFIKKHAVVLINDSKMCSLGGFTLKDKAITPEELEAHIMAILEIQSYNKEVKCIDFTRYEKTKKSFRHPIILLMIANCLIWLSKGSDTPIIDLFPKMYTVILIRLVSSACAHVSFMY